jgi:hypothetical protein
MGHARKISRERAGAACLVLRQNIILIATFGAKSSPPVSAAGNHDLQQYHSYLLRDAMLKQPLTATVAGR